VQGFDPAQAQLAGDQGGDVLLVLKLVGQHVAGVEASTASMPASSMARRAAFFPHRLEQIRILPDDRDLPGADDADVA
jgi:hypothetical protein